MFLVIALVLFCELSLTRAQELNQTFTTSEGFLIKLPDDWKRIEKSTLDDSTKNLFAKMPNDHNNQVKNVRDGFELKTVQQGIAYPIILVSSTDMENMTEQNFRKFAKILKQNQKELQGAVDSRYENNTYKASVGVNDIKYDEQGHFIIVSSAVSVPNFGLLHSIDVTFRTDSGILVFDFTSEDKDYAENAALFSKILGSIEIPQALRISDNDNAGEQSADYTWQDRISKWVGFIIAFSIVSYLAKRKGKSQAKADAPIPLVDDTVIPQTPRREGADVHFSCHSCGQSISTDASSVGQQFPCPNCSEELAVPEV